MTPRTGLPALALAAIACATEAPSTLSGEAEPRTRAVVAVDRTEHADGSPPMASALARFVRIPAGADAEQALAAAGAGLDLPAPGTCRAEDEPDLAPPLGSADPIELLAAGEVTLSAGPESTVLVPHAFPALGTFAAGVLYATPDQAADALPAGARYALAAFGSDLVGAIRADGDAPGALADVRISGVPLGSVTTLSTGRPLRLEWAPGHEADLVTVELLAFDGAPPLVCAFEDAGGQGVVPAGMFRGTGTGRLALHRLRVLERGAAATESTELRFDVAAAAAVELHP